MAEVFCNRCGFHGEAEPPFYTHWCGYSASPVLPITNEQRAEIIAQFPMVFVQKDKELREEVKRLVAENEALREKCEVLEGRRG